MPGVEGITMRKAAPADAPFIGRLYEDGLAGGHYRSLGMPAAQAIEAMIRQPRFSVASGADILEVFAQFVLIEQDGRPVGFLAQRVDGTLDPGVVELWFFSIVEVARKQGIARHVLHTMCEDMRRDPRNRGLFARCFTPSTAMVHLLKKAGFRKVRNTKDRTDWRLRWRP
jgi:RimJ/RimL family protein N-acetyltransferase